jgi:hypothetical protein
MYRLALGTVVSSLLFASTCGGSSGTLRECILPRTPGRADDLLHAQRLI